MGRAIRTRFRFGFVPERLNLAAHHNSPVHYAKGTPSHVTGADRSASGSTSVSDPKVGICHSAPTACKCTVSGSLSSPHGGSYHLSLTLLFTIGRQVVFSLTGWSPRIHTGFHGTGVTRDAIRSAIDFIYRAITFFGRPYPGLSTINGICNSVRMVPRPRPL